MSFIAPLFCTRVFIFFSHVFLLSSLFYFCVTCKYVCLTRGNQYFIVLLFSSFFCLKKLFILELNFSSFVLSFPLLSFLSVSLLILSPFLDSSPCLPFYNHQPFCYHFRLLVSSPFLASSSLLVPYLPVSKFSLPSPLSSFFSPFLSLFPFIYLLYNFLVSSPLLVFSSPLLVSSSFLVSFPLFSHFLSPHFPFSPLLVYSHSTPLHLSFPCLLPPSSSFPLLSHISLH